MTSVAIGPTIQAMRASMRQVEFGEVRLLSDQALPAGTESSISWRRIGKLASRAEYSRFLLRELADYIGTSHALCVQWDGFVLNGAAWDPAFLEFDYIGAPWPHFHDGHDVGNGGFSLRSRRLLEACRRLPFDGLDAEDVVIGRKCRSDLEAQGIRFAPAVVARRFAYERLAPTGDEFGFHGAFNLVEHISRDDALHVFRSLEPGMLANNERLELLWWALRRWRPGLAGTMLRRLI